VKGETNLNQNLSLQVAKLISNEILWSKRYNLPYRHNHSIV